jgi:putative transposase
LTKGTLYITGVCADGAYRKHFRKTFTEFYDKVERTFGWANFSRRLSKDYERTVSSSETMFIISHAHTLLKRL